MTAWYNENDPRMANVLRELIHEGHIAPGVVDDRSIVDVRASDLRGFTQCHFFAGIGVWSHALRRAGWPDDRPCWTGSCPCQPFSLAGNGGGFDDPRHLWPHWFRLISEYRPGRCFGEQVASAGLWLDLVQSDLENLGFAFAAPDLAAAGFAGAHIRQRFFWVADAYDTEWWADHAPRHLGDWAPTGRLEGYGDAAGRGGTGWVANADGRDPGAERQQRGGEHGQLTAHGGAGSLAHAALFGWRQERADLGWGVVRMPAEGRPTGLAQRGDVDWLWCRDAAWRPVEPGTLPLVDEAPARLGRLHGYGNAIDAETLTQFLSAYIDAAEGRQ